MNEQEQIYHDVRGELIINQAVRIKRLEAELAKARMLAASTSFMGALECVAILGALECVAMWLHDDGEMTAQSIADMVADELEMPRFEVCDYRQAARAWKELARAYLKDAEFFALESARADDKANDEASRAIELRADLEQARILSQAWRDLAYEYGNRARPLLAALQATRHSATADAAADIESSDWACWDST